MRSIRLQLLTGLSLSLLLVVGIVILAAYWRTRSILYSNLDETLQQKAFVLSTMVEFTERGLEFEDQRKDGLTNSQFSEDVYFQIHRQDGSLFVKSENLGTSLLKEKEVENSEEFYDLRFPNGADGRAIGISFHPKIWEEACLDDQVQAGDNTPLRLADDPSRLSESMQVTVAVPYQKVNGILEELIWFFCLICGAVFLLVPVGVYGILSLGFQPIKRVADEVAIYDGKNLGFRVRSENVSEEIQPVVVRLNELLEKIELTVIRERSFSSDVAHELRTPLAGIISSIEVCMVKERQTPEYIETLQLCLDICRQSQGLVNELLVISQIEDQQSKLQMSEIDLGKMVKECWKAVETTANEKNIEVKRQWPTGTLVESDEGKLRLVVLNLLENAASHCNDFGKISIRVSEHSSRPLLLIENTGNLVRKEDVKFVFERFWQADQSRTAVGKHFGLGLYLVRQLCDLLSIQIEVDVVGEVFKVKLFFSDFGSKGS